MSLKQRLAPRDEALALNGIRLDEDECLSCKARLFASGYLELGSRCQNDACRRPFPWKCAHKECENWVQPRGEPPCWEERQSECADCEKAHERSRRIQDFFGSAPRSIARILEQGNPPPSQACPGWEIYDFLATEQGAPLSALSLVGPDETRLTVEASWAVLRLLTDVNTAAMLVEEEELLQVFSKFFGTLSDVRYAAQAEVDRIKEHPIVIITGALGRGRGLTSSLRFALGSWIRYRMQEGLKTVLISKQELRLGAYVGERVGALWADLGKTLLMKE